jgi:hypothetical protein
MRTVVAFALVVALAGAVLLGGTPSQAQEKKVDLDKLPKAVAAAVKARFPDGKVLGASKETADGKTVYEVTVEDKGQKIDATITAEGAITTLEKTVALKDVPKVVVKAVRGKYPKADVKLVEEVIHVKGKKETLAYYEFHLVVGKKTVEVEVSPEGKILKEEGGKEGKKEKDKK